MKNLPKETGEQLKNKIIELAQYKQWKVANFRPARTNKGWRTPVSADGKGFPDLILVNPPLMMALECKGQDEEVFTEQVEWITVFKLCGIYRAAVVRPSDWQLITSWLGVNHG